MHSRGKQSLVSSDHLLQFGRGMAIVGICALGALTSQAQATGISNAERHADWPSAEFAPNGDLWVAWTEYDGRGADEVKVRYRSGEGWHEAMSVTPRVGDYLKTGLAIEPDGRVWIVWAAQVSGNVDLYA